MSTEIPSKLNKLLQNLPTGAVATDVWLKKNGISNDLKRRYIASQWLEPIGHGASKRFGDSIDWPGSVWAALHQGIKLHVGGKTALGLHGLSHYVRDNDLILLFKEPKSTMPKWFFEVLSDKKFYIINTKFISFQICIYPMSIDGLDIPISQPERAIIEHLFLVGKTESFEEASLLMETLTGLRPNILQQLLESCSSIKVKRMLLFFGEYHDHAWFRKLELKNIKLGSGNRQVVRNGVLDNKYKITIPKRFLENEKNVY